MTESEDDPKPGKPAVYETQDIDTGSTLLPMLIGGLVLVVVGAMVMMAFV